MSLPGWTGYVIAALVGFLVGWVELALRYSDAPQRVLTWGSAWAYLLTNAGASAFALVVLRTFHLDFHLAGPGRELVQVLVAGIGAMTIFRAKLFTASEGTDQGEVKLVVSPSTLLERILAIGDEQVERRQAEARLAVLPVVDKLTWTQAQMLVPLLIKAKGTRSKRAKAKVAELAKEHRTLLQNPQGWPDWLRVRLLGMAIVNYAGPKLLRKSIPAIQATSSAEPPPSDSPQVA